MSAASRQPAILGVYYQRHTCPTRTDARHYPFLPRVLNDLLCAINECFHHLPAKAESLLVIDGFARLGFSIVAVLQLEATRQQTWLAKNVNLFLLLGQFISGAVCLPLYFAVLSSSSSKAGGSFKAEQAWAALLSSCAAYALPTYCVHATSWSHDALSIWQIFPLLLMGAQPIIARLAAPYVRGTRQSLPIYMIGLLGLAASTSQHLRMLKSRASLQAMFLPFWNHPRSLIDEVHIGFLLDYLLCILAVASFLVFQYAGQSTGSKVRSISVLVILTVLSGPGGAVAVFWTAQVLLWAKAVFAKHKYKRDWEHGRPTSARDRLEGE
jgi:hypothetical protein